MAKDYTKIGIAAVLGLFLIFLIVQIVEFSGRRQEARAKYEVARTEHDRTLADQEKIREDFKYYSDPANLSKELRSRFNYTLPGEKMLIFVQEGATEPVSD